MTYLGNKNIPLSNPSQHFFVFMIWVTHDLTISVQQCPKANSFSETCLSWKTNYELIIGSLRFIWDLHLPRTRQVNLHPPHKWTTYQDDTKTFSHLQVPRTEH